MKISTLFRTAVLLTALIGTTLTATAYDFVVDGIYYNINSDGKTLSVTYENSSYNSYSGNVTVPSNVSYGSTSYEVTSIGLWAFYKCINLTSVTIPNTVTSIGSHAFCNCTSLSNITIPNSVTSIANSAFGLCSSLTSIEIPSSVATIGDSAFDGCTALTTLNYNAVSCADFNSNYHPFKNTNISTINIGSSVKSIPGRFAYTFNKLTSIYIPGTVTTIGDHAFYGCTTLTSINIPKSVNTINASAFSGCTALTRLNYYAISCADFSSGSSHPFYNTNISSLYIGSGVQRIPANFAYNMTKFDSTIIPASVTSIGNNAFTGCSGLTYLDYYAVSCADFSTGSSHPFYKSNLESICILDGVKTIPANFAYGISNINYVDIPTTITNIGKDAFYNCSGLKKVNISDLSAWLRISFYNGDANPLYYAHRLFLNGQEVKDLVIPSDITSIYFAAFYGCSGLTSVTIPNHVRYINKSAFCYCSGLKSAIIGNGVYTLGDCAFYDCSSLNNLVIGNSVSSIGEYAFNGCTSLNYVEIPSSVYSIAHYAFYGCSYLNSITLPSSITAIEEHTFDLCERLNVINIPDKVQTIGAYAFNGCKGVNIITIGKSVTSIANSAFSGCHPIILNWNAKNCNSMGYMTTTDITQVSIGLGVEVLPSSFMSGSKITTVTIPSSVTSIGTDAFKNCSSITKLVWNAKNCSSMGNMPKSNISQVTIGTTVESIPDYFIQGSSISSIVIPNSVKSISRSAFSGCAELTNATIANSVTTISSSAFESCSKLTNITIPNSVITIDNCAFQNCTSLNKVSFGNSVTTIGYQAFYGCSKLSSVNIPNSVNSIGESVFSGCSSMTSATIGNSISTIQRNTFSNCSSLNRVVIGNSVNSIQNGVFYGCKNLTKVYCRANMPPKYEPYYSEPLFEGIVYQNAILYVPDLTYSYYLQADPWKNFMEIKTESYSDDGVSFMSYIYPTSIKMDAVAGTGTQQANSYFTFQGSKYNTLLVTGLEPTSIYSGTYTSRTPEGTTETPFKFFTLELTMVPEGAKMLTETTALLKAETNMADEETMCGFDWRLYEGPDDYLGTRVYCPVYDGTMAGTLKGLKKDTYYKYRPVYKSNGNNVYYGDWVTFYTGDVGVEFDPVVYTYNSPEVTQNTATLQGVALRGSDQITEQGFEYWKRNGSVSKVTAEGERMSKTVTDLTAGTTYTFRAYLKAGGKTTYGREVDFVTVSGGMDVNADGTVNIADVNLIINYILSGKYGNQGDVNGDGTINITDVNLIINEILSH